MVVRYLESADLEEVVQFVSVALSALHKSRSGDA